MKDSKSAKKSIGERSATPIDAVDSDAQAEYFSERYLVAVSELRVKGVPVVSANWSSFTYFRQSGLDIVPAQDSSTGSSLKFAKMETTTGSKNVATAVDRDGR